MKVLNCTALNSAVYSMYSSEEAGEEESPFPHFQISLIDKNFANHKK